MEFEATISARKLKHAISVLQQVNDEAIFRISDIGITSHVVNSANAIMARVIIPSETFDIFIAPSEYGVGIDLKEVTKILKLATVEDTIHISESSGMWYFTREIHQRSLPLLDPAQLRKPPGDPDIECTASIRLTGKDFKEIVAEAGDVGEQVIFSVAKDGRGVFESISKHKRPTTYIGKIPANRVELVSANTEVRCIYAIDYLEDIAKDMKVSDDVVVRFSTNMPCAIEYVRDAITISYVLGPRIENY